MLCFAYLKERDSLKSKVEELEEMLEAEKEQQQKKAEEISSDEDAEHAKHMAEEFLMMHVEALQEENETLRCALRLLVLGQLEEFSVILFRLCSVFFSWEGTRIVIDLEGD